MLYRSGPYLTAHHDPGLARAFNPQGAQQSLVYALTSAGGAGSSTWQPPSTQRYLSGRHSGKCLTDPSSGPNGTQLEITACKETTSAES